MGDREAVFEKTSAIFQGMIAMCDPDHSWVGRWQRLDNCKYVKGIYAISVTGELPEYVLENLPARTLVRRDRSTV